MNPCRVFVVGPIPYTTAASSLSLFVRESNTKRKKRQQNRALCISARIPPDGAVRKLHGVCTNPVHRQFCKLPQYLSFQYSGLVSRLSRPKFTSLAQHFRQQCIKRKISGLSSSKRTCQIRLNFFLFQFKTVPELIQATGCDRQMTTCDKPTKMPKWPQYSAYSTNINIQGTVLSRKFCQRHSHTYGAKWRFPTVPLP